MVMDADVSYYIELAKHKYNNFILKCLHHNKGFSLTVKDDFLSPYALCFAIFGLHLVKNRSVIEEHAFDWDLLLRKNLDDFKYNQLSFSIDLMRDKPYLQLLTFTLSALSILGTLTKNPLKDHVLPIISEDIFVVLDSKGVFKGKPQSGNFSMFYAILLEHARLFLGIDQQLMIEKWIDNHLDNINSNGFWGDSPNMTYLQFQNGYHQYEMFDYFGVENKFTDTAAMNVTLLADTRGHFAPYPGGGGCFDYDAIFIISMSSSNILNDNRDLLYKTLNSILCIQNRDGGFSESQHIRPRNFKNIYLSISHILNSSNFDLKIEGIKYAATLLRNKHNKILTHWSKNPRDWSESNLWDSWFRMLTIARLDLLLNNGKNAWGFIEYPGIGYHSDYSK